MIEKQNSVEKSGGMSQLETTAPKDFEDQTSGGRFTADLKRLVDTKHANVRLAEEALSPQLVSKQGKLTGQKQQEFAIQKRSASVYQKPRGMNDTF